MSQWKRQVNSAMRKLTGHQIVRARDDSSPKPAPSPASRQQSVAADSKPKTQLKARPKPAEKFPADYDDEAKEIIKTVRPYTMTHNDKLFALISATRYVNKYRIPGDIVECGVWRGGSMHAVARTLLAADDTSRDLYLFDTFEGMPPPSDKDVRHDGISAQELLDTQPRTSKMWAIASLEDVQGEFAKVPYPPERVHFIPGMVEETAPAKAPEQISILRLDTDWYESTRHELETLYPRLVPGGVLIIDDYGWYEGSRQAVEEFIEKTGAQLLLLRIASGRIAVKL